jgi:ATP-dependent Clp protease adaptor protein ClpS
VAIETAPKQKTRIRLTQSRYPRKPGQTGAFYSSIPHFVNRLEKNLIGITIVPTNVDFTPMATRHQDELAIATKRMVSPPPPLYKVILLNDDYTPMEFVIEVLERYFFLDREQATTIMLKVHNEGAGVAGIYPRDVAETKVRQVREYARSHQHPLQCVMEETE